MDLEQTQHILSRLYTDEKFRTDFIANQEQFFWENEIKTPEAIAFFSSLSPEQLNFFANGLLSKRKHAVIKLIPASFKLMADSFGSYFREHAARFSPDGIHIHHTDALNFINYVAGIDANFKTNNYWNEVMNFERLLLLNFLKPPVFKISFHSFNPLHFYKRIVTEGNLSNPRLKKTILIWRKGKYKRVY